MCRFSYSDFSSILKEIKWPFVTSAVSSKQAETWKKHEKKFSKLFSLLLKLDNNMVLSRTPTEGLQKTKLGEPVVLPLELLLTPLRKRFKYHFTGDKKTNSKEKVHTCTICHVTGSDRRTVLSQVGEYIPP